MRYFLLPALLLNILAIAHGETVKVSNLVELKKALADAKPGTRIEVAPGEYNGGFYLKNIQGTKEQPIVFTGADQKNPPVFHGQLQFSAPAWLEIQDIKVTGIKNSNGLNIDDAADVATPAHDVTIRRVQVEDIGPNGNWDGIKVSGLDHFLITGCRIERWGTAQGSGIDFVGCHEGIVENCTIKHVNSADLKVTGHDGIQMKGGCREIVIRFNRFESAGLRGVNIGGSTGMQFFRPPLASLKPDEPRSEAKDITVEENLFVETQEPVCFVGTDGAMVRRNTLVHPNRYAIRILQETREPGFVPSRNGKFQDNLIVFKKEGWTGGVNIGDGTAPETFSFERNWWYCEDAPKNSKPKLPTAETGGIYGQDPKLDANLRPPEGTGAARFGVSVKEVGAGQK